MSLDDETLRTILRAELDARSRIDVETHADHHAFIAELIDRAKRRRELWDKVRQQVIGWAVIASLGACATYVAREVSRILRGG